MKEDKTEEYNIEGIELPENKTILEDAEVKGLNITDVSLLSRAGNTTYSAKIQNNTAASVTIKKLYVLFS